MKLNGIPNIYKGREFPFNLDLFNCFSKYFSTSSSECKINPNSQVQLYDDEKGKFPIEYFPNFLQFCQNQKITITNENVIPLHNLAKKFSVPTLIEVTKNYITEHSTDFVLDFLRLHKDCEFDFELYENIISSKFTDYIQNELIFTLDIPRLYRIFTKYQETNPNEIQQSLPEIIDFLFKCLDKFGRKASVLFENINFGAEETRVVQKLLDDPYCKIFDFHSINQAYLTTMYQLQSKLFEQEERIKIQQDQIQKQQDQITHLIQIEIGQKLAALSSRFDQQLNSCKDQVEDLKSKIEQQENQIKILKQPRISLPFIGDNNKTSGILNFLKKTLKLSAGGKTSNECPLTNLLDYNNNYFYNYVHDYHYPRSTEDSSILFDFGEKVRIDLASYLIRSNGNEPFKSHHAKSWEISGSNDNNQWKILDEVRHDDHLNGPFLEHHFKCKKSDNGSQENRFRYIKYTQFDNWSDGSGEPINPFDVYITFFEMYGDIFYTDTVV